MNTKKISLILLIAGFSISFSAHAIKGFPKIKSAKEVRAIWHTKESSKPKNAQHRCPFPDGPVHYKDPKNIPANICEFTNCLEEKVGAMDSIKKDIAPSCKKED